MAIENYLENDKINIIYVDAYLRYWVDKWEGECPSIGNMPEILGTLYNIGDNAPQPHSDSKPNSFGKYLKKNYNYIKKKIKLKLTVV